MGGAFSKTNSAARQSLRKVLPVADKKTTSSYSGRSIVEGWGVFADDADRERFIYAVVFIVTENGKQKSGNFDLSLDNTLSCHFSLDYRRGYGVEDWEKYYAKLEVYTGYGFHGLKSQHFGATKQAAFEHLKAEVEKQLALILSREKVAESGDADIKVPTSGAEALPFRSVGVATDRITAIAQMEEEFGAYVDGASTLPPAYSEMEKGLR